MSKVGSVEMVVILNLSVVTIAKLMHVFIVLVALVHHQSVVQIACSVFLMQWLFSDENSH